MDLYFVTAAILFITQMANLRSLYSLEIDIFKQKVRYFAYKGYLKTRSLYNYVSNLFFPREEPKISVVKPKQERYEDKYKQKYDEMEITYDEHKRFNSILFETTPNGNVIMRYNDKTFEYYSDKVIPFRFLETVSRKYVIYFKCKSIITETEKRNENIRYTYLGKIANFSLLQKPDKKTLNKKLNMSFREYKNMKL